MKRIGLFCSRVTGQVNRELMYVLIWFLIMLGSLQKILYKLLVLFYSSPVVKSMTLWSPCLFVALERSPEQTFFKAFILHTNLQHLLSLLCFHIAISNLVAHCISIPLRCHILESIMGWLTGKAMPRLITDCKGHHIRHCKAPFIPKYTSNNVPADMSNEHCTQNNRDPLVLEFVQKCY